MTTSAVRFLLFSCAAWLADASPACDPKSAGGEACPAPEVTAHDLSNLLQKAVKVEGLSSDGDDKGVGSTLQSQAKSAIAAGGSPAETVNEFCDHAGVARMHGYLDQNGTMIKGEQEVLMESIMEDIGDELEGNSIDQMVKDIFSFYICVRWVPDEVFWKVAEQELAAEILESVVDKSETPTQAIGELYQNFKFAPLLCSRNLKVYEKRSEKDNSYFSNFRDKVMNISVGLSSMQHGLVWNKLKKADELFCGKEKMNDPACDVKLNVNAFFNWATAWLGDWGTDLHEHTDKWGMMEDVFRQFRYHDNNAAWNDDFSAWKNLFPYHSFIAKPEGVAPAHSPKSSQRFLVCFGKRIASELHRRPRGDHIITDQNNIGCHGWWDANHVSAMLKRTVALWKPPTCDLAEMSYTMKKQILQQFLRMNEQLFESLPSQLSDEDLEANGEIDEDSKGPPPFDVASVTVGDTEYFNGTRVVASTDIIYDNPASSRRRCWWACEKKIGKGHAGTLAIDESSTGPKIPVRWDGDDHGPGPRSENPSHFKVVPHEYGLPVDGILDAIKGWTQSAFFDLNTFMSTFWGNQYTSLAHMMSGSFAKWVVCPLAANISLEDLDNNLGTEDAVFQEFTKEAYGKWTGYNAKLPGEVCAKEDETIDPTLFPGCQVCEFADLYVDLGGKYFNESGQQEEFMCPIKAPMDDAEQLKVFAEKHGMCLLHMTEKQVRQHQWPYNGHHPARAQYPLEMNPPLPEFELVKLLDIERKPGLKQISYGRTCTAEEMTANPRFCGLNQVNNPWSSITKMAQLVSVYLQGSYGMPIGAVKDIIINTANLLSQNLSTNETLKRGAIALGEEAWNHLMGLGRLAHSAVQDVANDLLYTLPASEKRHARLEAELFAFKHGGDFLHSMSYQNKAAANNRSSIVQQRYRRYAVVCPCKKFDPGMELALKHRWSEIVLRVTREGLKHNPLLLSHSYASVKVRAEAKLFWRLNTEALHNSTWFSYHAAIDAGCPGCSPPAQVSCKRKGSWWKGYHCKPTDDCTLLQNNKCVPKLVPPKGPWRVVWDKKLAEEVGGSPLGEQPLSAMSALTVTIYCGRKKDFNATGGPGKSSSSLKECMESGVKANAAMKSEKPWKVYFPDEVIVVAVFGTIEDSKCISTNPQTEGKVCYGAKKVPGLDSHLGNSDKGDPFGVYHGLHTGSGLPEGSLKEVVLRPEDILEVNGLLV